MELLYTMIPFVFSLLFIFRWDAVKIEEFPKEISFKETLRRVFFMPKK